MFYPLNYREMTIFWRRLGYGEHLGPAPDDLGSRATREIRQRGQSIAKPSEYRTAPAPNPVGRSAASRAGREADQNKDQSEVLNSGSGSD